MLHLRLPYFYNLPLAIMLVFYVVNTLEGIFGDLLQVPVTSICDGGSEIVFYLKFLLIALPALTAATYFFREFYYRHDLYVREALYILSVVHVLSYLLPAFLF